MATTVFVYGSLKVGHSAHGLLNGAERLADGVLDGVQCIEHEGYPMLVAGDDAISGEVYRVNAEQLLTLDAYEEAPEVYARVERQLIDGRWVNGYMEAAQNQQPQAKDRSAKIMLKP